MISDPPGKNISRLEFCQWISPYKPKDMRLGRGDCELWIKIGDRSATMACSISSCAHGTSDAPFSLCFRIFMWVSKQLSVFPTGCGDLFTGQEFYNDVRTTKDFTVQRFHELACRSGSFCWPPRISLDGLGWSVPTPLVSCAQSNTSTEVHSYLIGLVYHGMV